MADNKIMGKIVEKLYESMMVPMNICDVSGRVTVSTNPLNIGKMNLLALEALNLNSKATASQDSQVQPAGAAIPLRFQNSRIGALVIEDSRSSEAHIIEMLAGTIELLYEEYIRSKHNKSRSQERDQFLYEWLHLQSGYTENLKKQGQQFGIDITGIYTVIVTEEDPDKYPFMINMLQKSLEEKDILLSLSQNQNLIILQENDTFQKRYRRILSLFSDCHTGICSGEPHLHTAYQAAAESLRLGKLLFPDQYEHSYHKMRLAILLSQMRIPGIEDIFADLVSKGKNAGLAETAITYLQLNGDIQKISEKLHIHRNSIPYRLKRIEEISGWKLSDSYDLLCLYTSFIQYAGKADRELAP